MKFETRVELKVIVPILLFLGAQLIAAIAWGYSVGERLSALEQTSQRIESIDGKLDKMNQNILDIARELAR
jgi:hypothetical protein